MKIAYSILSRFVDLADIPPQILAERLTLSGLEVSSLEDRTRSLEHVVVGRLLSVRPHPNADKLSLTEVEIPGRTLRIVCGAKNIAPGDVVPVALVGAVLPGNFRIQRAKIRGEESEGMLCSERELGISEEHAGIMHLPAETPLGTPVASLPGVSEREALLEVEITPNRPDCLSHLGVARQTAAVLDKSLTVPEINLEEHDPAASDACAVSIEPESGCGRYCARVIRGVKVGPSPAWLKTALEKIGQRSVNNLVDVTNYVMLEIGHPLHAFDLDRLSGARVQARLARAGEMLVTLDGVNRKLAGGELVIADAEKPVALAGVMGGRDTEVTDGTVNILLEAAWFDPRAVRLASRRTGCASESSYRFERGTDPEIGLTLALDRAAQLIVQVSGGRLARGILNEYPGRKDPAPVALRLARAEKILGLALSPAACLNALARLGYLSEPATNEGEFQVRIPSFRRDVSREEDLIEDIAQVLGYDRIPVAVPTVPLTLPAPDPRRDFVRECRELAAGFGLQEIITYSFMDPVQFENLRLPQEHPWRAALAVKNPLNVETSLLRTSLLPGLIETLAYNARRGRERIYLFETGAVFLPEPKSELPREPWHLGVALTGPRHPADWRNGRDNRTSDFYDVKGVLESLVSRLKLQPLQTGAPAFRFEAAELPFLHPCAGFQFCAPDGRVLGWAGELHPECRERYKLKNAVMAAEIDLEALLTYRSARAGIKPFSRFPASVRDLSLAVTEETRAGDVMRAIRQVGGSVLAGVEPFDVYHGENLPAGTKSLAFSLTFQSEDRTLQEEELKKHHARILEHLQKTFGAQLR